MSSLNPVPESHLLAIDKQESSGLLSNVLFLNKLCQNLAHLFLKKEGEIVA
jgi:hypothetical protein